MILAAAQLLDLDLLLLSFDLEDVIGQRLNLCEIANVANFPNAKLTLEITSDSKNFFRLQVAVCRYQDRKLIPCHKLSNFIGIEPFEYLYWLITAQQRRVHGRKFILMGQLHVRI
jgi:hypothetical protein